MTADGIADHHHSNHRNEKPHICNEAGCGKAFIQLTNLKRHMRSVLKPAPVTADFMTEMIHSIHTREKPHKCHHKDCDEAFTSGKKLKQHERSEFDLLLRDLIRSTESYREVHIKVSTPAPDKAHGITSVVATDSHQQA